MHYFIGLVIISVCFNIDVRIYGTLLFLPAAPPPFFPFSSWLFCHFDIDVCIYSTCTLFYIYICFDCQVDFDVDNVQRRELVIFYGA